MKRFRMLKMLIMVLVLSMSMPAAGVLATETQTEAAATKSKTYKNEYDANGTFYDAKGYPIRKSTILNFLKTALQPVGKTVYVWGGGWKEDIATHIGVLPQWESFFNQQSSKYNYKKTRYQSYNGLDCSGFVSWALYNTFNTESGHGSFLMLAQKMAGTYGDWGWGEYSSARKFKDQKPGDIMSTSEGHVYIVIGRCSDGSLVILHSSPKGVMINGTVSKKGKKKSQAWKLARKCMRQYYPAWYAKYPDVSRGKSYLRKYSKMSWYVDGRTNSVMTDPEGIRNMNAAQVLSILFS